MIDIRKQVPLAPLTTFKIGGAAAYFTEIKSCEELREALAWAKEKEVRFTVLAGGSNVLVSDDGFDGLVIHIRCEHYSFEGGELTADAGCNLLALIHEAGQQRLGGWEKLAGIPGSLGGAIRGNAGAFGSEIKDFLVQTRALHVETGEIREFANAACDFSYRHSFFKDHPEWIILQATVELAKVEASASVQLSDETIAERERRHLQNVQAAGSYFMNPQAPDEVVARFETEKGVKAREGRVPAGWLIELAGMKGAIVGGAQASEQHPNYLVNIGNATAADVRSLAEAVKAKVFERFGIELQEEAATI